MTQSIFQSALTRAEYGRTIAADLLLAKKNLNVTDARELAVHAHRIKTCNSNKNFIVSDELVNIETGEEFAGSIQLWRCGSIFCPNCLARKSHHNRRRTRKILETYKQLTGYRYRFITLTMPTPPCGLRQTRSIINYAWSLLRKKKSWRSVVRSYAKSEEFTVTKRGYHYHIHIFADAKYYDKTMLRRHWTDAVERSCQKHEVDFIVESKDGLCVAHLQLVSDNEKAIKEVCKYITKSDSWSKLDTKSLIELAFIRRWSRMFELGGDFRQPRETVDDNAYLDTRPLSDGKNENERRGTATTHWRDDAIYDDPAISERFEERVIKCQRFRLMQLHRRYGIEAVFDLDGQRIDLASL